eukprot:5991483-Lingulodinium_polyedra.AAC.1
MRVAKVDTRWRRVARTKLWRGVQVSLIMWKCWALTSVGRSLDAERDRVDEVATAMHFIRFFW